MADTVENLILDLLEWAGRKERTYQETMDAWRTSCPKLPVWEDATERGLVETVFLNGRSLVRVTPEGLALLKERGRGSGRQYQELSCRPGELQILGLRGPWRRRRRHDRSPPRPVVRRLSWSSLVER